MPTHLCSRISVPYLLLLLSLPAAGQDADTAAPKAIVSDGKPIARIKGSIICCPREKILLDGWASIAVGSEVTAWLWDLTGRGRPDTVCSSGELIVTAPSRTRTYSVSLRVRDKRGNLSEPDTCIVYVQDVPPTVSLRADTTVKVGVRVHFQPRVTTVCNPVVRYEWDMDDDGAFEYHSASDGNTSKEYHTPGRYSAHFRVVDAAGREAGAITVVNVVDRVGADNTAAATSTSSAPADPPAAQ